MGQKGMQMSELLRHPLLEWIEQLNLTYHGSPPPHHRSAENPFRC